MEGEVKTGGKEIRSCYTRGNPSGKGLERESDEGRTNSPPSSRIEYYDPLPPVLESNPPIESYTSQRTSRQGQHVLPVGVLRKQDL